MSSVLLFLHCSQIIISEFLFFLIYLFIYLFIFYSNELTRLWNLCPDNLEACKADNRFSIKHHKLYTYCASKGILIFFLGAVQSARFLGYKLLL